jgi:SAM-dependent methyltransferase
MLIQVQRMAIPELTRIYGQYGLYLRPTVDISPDLSGNMLANTIVLQRQGDALDGQLRCLDAELPFSSASLSLVYSLFMLENSPAPAELVQEIARCLKPEGVLLLIGFNAWSPARLSGRWGTGLRSGIADERLATAAGLEIVRRQYLGPFWPSAGSAQVDSSGSSWLDRFRAARLLVLRRRESALTPLRKVSAAVSLRPGMSAG